jgi:hypothetical protein
MEEDMTPDQHRQVAVIIEKAQAACLAYASECKAGNAEGLGVEFHTAMAVLARACFSFSAVVIPTQCYVCGRVFREGETYECTLSPCGVQKRLI